MYQLYDKNRDRPKTGAKHVKTASFFIKTGFSFVKNSLQSRLRPGCTHHTDPGAEEVQTRVCVRPLRGCGDVYPPCWRCFYALFLHLIRRKRSFYASLLYLNGPVLSMVIIVFTYTLANSVSEYHPCPRYRKPQ